MGTVVLLPTTMVVIGNVALLAPAATATLAGTVTAALLLDSVTVAPPVGAAPLRVTVPVDELPPTTLVGFTVTEDKMGPVDALLTNQPTDGTPLEFTMNSM